MGLIADDMADEIAADPARLRALQDMLDADADEIPKVYWPAVAELIDRALLFLPPGE